jgi:hypothetical protein
MNQFFFSDLSSAEPAFDPMPIRKKKAADREIGNLGHT